MSYASNWMLHDLLHDVGPGLFKRYVWIFKEFSLQPDGNISDAADSWEQAA